MNNLPQSYFEDILVLMPVEPGKAYAYWDVFTPSLLANNNWQNDVDNLGQQLHEIQLVFKIYKILNFSELIFTEEYFVNFQSGSLFLNLDWENYRYQGELAFIDSQGCTQKIIRSNQIGKDSTQSIISGKQSENEMIDFPQKVQKAPVDSFFRTKTQSLTEECEVKFQAGISSITKPQKFNI